MTILGLLIVIMCGQVLGRYRSGANVQAQMAEAGKFITAVIVWFQFLALPLVAVVVTSTAISEEVNSRTLAVLMTTPLSSRQLVNGKLLGRLSQILFLAATSLPLLAIVRVLGGVSWSFLLQGLCITLASTIFAASVSLFFSTLCRRAYTVVLASIVSIGFLFVVVPFIGLVLLGGDASNRAGRHGLSFHASRRTAGSLHRIHVVSPWERIRVLRVDGPMSPVSPVQRLGFAVFVGPAGAPGGAAAGDGRADVPDLPASHRSGS